MSQDITLQLTDRKGITHSLLAPTDMEMNLMELCKSYEFPIEGTCGGMALCASCQVYVTSAHSLPERSDEEEAMLSEAFHVQENSRLGCQIRLSQELDGIEVTIAPEE